MNEKDVDHNSSTAPVSTTDVIPSPYPAEAPPPYVQQPSYTVSPGYEAPIGCQTQPGYQAPPGYPGQVYQGVPVGYIVANQPGTYLVQPTMQIPPPDYQALSWFACLCCCWPIGIVAILKSNEVRNALSRGDFNSARIASNSARNLAYTAVGIGVMFVVIYVALIMVFLIFSSVRKD